MMYSAWSQERADDICYGREVINFGMQNPGIIPVGAVHR